MKISMRAIVWFSLLVLSISAKGEILSRTIEPQSPTTSSVIRIRVAISACESSVGSASTNLTERRIRVEFLTPDFCDFNNPLHMMNPRFVEIGRLPAGHYEVEYAGCVLNPIPGNDPCTIVETDSVTVLGPAPKPLVVPALSWFGLSAMFGVLLLTGAAIGRPAQ